MAKLKTTFTLIMLFILAFNFTSSAQLQAKVKSAPITGNGDNSPCVPSNDDGTFGLSIPLKLTGITFDDCENGVYSGINNLPCDLHVGLTNLESGETFYKSLNDLNYQPVGYDSTLPGDIQDTIMYVDCSYDLDPSEVTGFYTKIGFNLPEGSEGNPGDCDDLGETDGVQYYSHTINIHINFYCLTGNGFELVNFCGPDFEPLIEGVKNCDESYNGEIKLCCDVETEEDPTEDPIGGFELKSNINDNAKAERLNNIQFEFSDVSVSINNLNSIENLRFEIINLNGKLIKRGQILAGSRMHSILYNTEMKTGIYFIRVYNSEGIVTKKFFKS